MTTTDTLATPAQRILANVQEAARLALAHSVTDEEYDQIKLALNTLHEGIGSAGDLDRICTGDDCRECADVEANW